ncbi:MAG: GNAT family N-acetyltransferase [Caldilineaceae bacterium]|nr:GNAT family N-acetyltransferase [Caldilineaceae bacterium]HRJ41078.1 GNAT family N-acetyltransferase [Caldilineaceae bacterium]
MQPAYRIETERTVLRCWQPGDAPLLSAAIEASLEHLKAWMPWAAGEPRSLDERVGLLRTFRAAFDKDEEYVYGIFNRDERAVIGGTGLHRRDEGNCLEIGYWIHVDFIGRGLATEISAALTKMAFEIHGVDWVEIRCDPNNIRSASVPRKLGYTLEATLRKRRITPLGKVEGTMIWSLFADEFPDSPSPGAKIRAFDVLGREMGIVSPTGG